MGNVGKYTIHGSYGSNDFYSYVMPCDLDMQNQKHKESKKPSCLKQQRSAATQFTCAFVKTPGARLLPLEKATSKITSVESSA